MRGSGVGAIFSSIFRHLIPLTKSAVSVGKKVLNTKTGDRVLKAVKGPAMQAGLDIAKDALEGENVLKSIGKHSKKAGKEAVRNVLSGKGCNRGKALKRGGKSSGHSAPPAKKKRKKRSNKSIMSDLGL